VRADPNSVPAITQNEVESKREVWLDVPTRTGDKDDDIQRGDRSIRVGIRVVVREGDSIVAREVRKSLLEVTANKDERRL